MFEMTDEEKAQLVGRYAHHWCDYLYKVMNSITAKDLVEFLKSRGVKLINQPNTKGEADGSMHWVFEIKDGWKIPGTDKKSETMTVSFFGVPHDRANKQNILDCIVRLSRSSGTPMEISQEIFEFIQERDEPRKAVREERKEEKTEEPTAPAAPPKANPLAGINTRKA